MTTGARTKYTKKPPDVHPWIRWDGDFRILEFLGGPPETPNEDLRKLSEFVETLDGRIPGWETAIYLGSILGILLAVLAVAVR